MKKETQKEMYSYRESTSVYNPGFIVENAEGMTVAIIYSDTFVSDDAAEKAAAKLTDFLNNGQAN